MLGWHYFSTMRTNFPYTFHIRPLALLPSIFPVTIWKYVVSNAYYLGHTVPSYDDNVVVESAAANATCSTRCWVQPCWGPGDDQCVHCPQYRHNVTRVCLQSCDELSRLYADDSAAQKQCRPCDPQCLNACNASVRFQLLLIVNQ